MDEDVEPVVVGEVKIPDLDQLPAYKWTERTMHAFFQRPNRDYSEDPILKKIDKAKRYGFGVCFKFRCCFHHKRLNKEIWQWVKYVDLMVNPQYGKVLDSIRFDPVRDRRLYLEGNPDAEWSDGVDEFDGQPDLALDRSGLTPEERRKRVKKHSNKGRWPEFSVSRFADGGNANDDDDEQPPEVVDDPTNDDDNKKSYSDGDSD